MRQFCDELGIKGEMPNITRTRKAGAKATSLQLTSGEMDNVSRQMGHNSHTSELYYRTKAAGKQSLVAYKNMTKMTTANPDKYVNVNTLIQDYFSDQIRDVVSPLAIDLKKFMKLHPNVQLSQKQIQDRVRAINRRTIREMKRDSENK